MVIIMQGKTKSTRVWTNQLVVMTANISFYYEVTQYLSRNGFRFLSALPTDTLITVPRVIITTHDELTTIQERIYLLEHLGFVPQVIAFESPYSQHQLEGELSRYLLLTRIGEWRQLTIGVDPGRSFGIVALINSMVVKQHQAHTPKRAAEIVCGLLGQFGTEENILRVGAGATRLKTQFLDYFAKLNYYSVRIEEVNEYGSNHAKTTQTEIVRHVDLAAATKIARTPGRKKPIFSQPPEPTKGEIRWIQQLSRRETGGLLTISKTAALQVLKGELNLESAIANHQKDL